jgi:hypothetical protein
MKQEFKGAYPYHVSIMVPAEFFRRMLPVPRCIASLKVRTMLLATATPVASSEGLKDSTIGGMPSAVHSGG